jgi:diguanylate cyclase (GGDEF)-like protein
MGLSSNAYAAGLSPYGVDLTPYGFMAVNVLLLIGLSPGQVFDLVSIAKSRVFDGMYDIVVIIDRNNRVADYNPALHQIVPDRGNDYAGELLPVVFEKHPEIAEFAAAHRDGETDIALNDGTGRVFRVHIRTVGQNSRRNGRRMLAKYLTMTDITKEMAMVRTMKNLADLDALTGIANRRSFYDQVEQLTGRQRVGCPVSIIMLDIDHFKAVNDTYGHRAGDMVLQGIASLLSQNTRAQDILARYGGEEFIIAVPGMGTEDAMALAERLRKSINAFEGVYDGQLIKVTASFGIACDTAGPGFNMEFLIRNADTALYEAKGLGRDTVVRR